MATHSVLDRIKRAYQRYPVLFHLPGWSIYIGLPYLLFIATPFAGNRDAIMPVLGAGLLDNTVSIVFFYLNYYYVTPYSLQKSRLRYILLATGLTIGVMLIADLVYYDLFLAGLIARIARQLPAPEATFVMANHFAGIPIPILITSLLSLLLLTSLSSGFAIYKYHNQHQIDFKQVMIDKKEAELSVLKLQISPHFLFNMLNNLRWLARRKSDATEEAILRLSEMMRYMLYQVDQGPVALVREVEYITNYVEIQKIRLAPNNHLQFQTVLDDGQVQVEPLLFIHFIENACKYGLHHEIDSEVTVALHQQADEIRFLTRNQLFGRDPVSHTTDSGIGIQNIERRLALYYPNRHTLRIYHKAGQFCVDLSIQLQQTGA